MKYEHELVISKYLGVNPIVINSSLVSAQNRVRNYWTNINSKKYGLFSDTAPDIPQPKDKGILLKDILQKEVSEKYCLSEMAIAKILRRNWSDPQIEPDKTGTILPKNNSGQLSVDSGTTLIQCVAMRGRNIVDGKRKDYFGAPTEQRLEPNVNGKTNALTSVQKDNLVEIVTHNMLPRSSKTGKGGRGHLSKMDNKSYCLDTSPNTNGIEIREVKQINPNIESGGKQPYQQNRVYDTNGISPALLADMSSGTHAILDKSPCLHGFEHGTNGQFNRQLGNGGLIRRLTEVECERLQTVPDNYTNHVSSTQRYKMLGNGWTVDAVAHIFNHIPKQNYSHDTR